MLSTDVTAPHTDPSVPGQPGTMSQFASETVPEHQRSAPYAEALNRHADRHPTTLMVPGHGGDASGAAAGLVDFLGERAVSKDISPMLNEIDLGPNSPLVQAQRLAAEAWGARRTWFMTNGASQANRTAALAVRGFGERIVSQRSAHSSFSDGVLLGGLVPAFVQPNVDERHGISHGVTPAALDAALSEQEAAGTPANSVYVISPSYFGSVSDVRGLADVAHAHGVPLIVDGAWGAHFGFHPELPESPVRLGADLVISSTHKLAGSLTQSAMLHLGDGPFADRLEALVERAYTMTASTSTNALLLGSLDIARKAMVTGMASIGESLVAARELEARVRADSRYAIVGDHFSDFEDIVARDLLRVTIDVSGLGASGHWVRDRLIEDHRIYFEMSTATTIVAVIGGGKRPDIDGVVAALGTVADAAAALPADERARMSAPFPKLPATGRLAMLPREAFFGETEVVSAAEAVGRIAADSLAAYPPGIPNVLPGEEITSETVDFLRAVAASPTGYVRGAVDPLVSRFRVVR